MCRAANEMKIDMSSVNSKCQQLGLWIQSESHVGLVTTKAIGKGRNPREGFSPVVYFMAFIAICNLSCWCSLGRWRLLRRRRSDCRKPVQTNLDLHNFCPLKFHFLFLFHVSYTNCNTNTQNMILWSDLSHTLWRREARVCNSCSCRPDQLSADHFHFLLLFHFSYTNCKRYTRNLIPWFDLSHTLFRREARVCNSCSQLQTRPALCRSVHNLGMLHLVFRISGSIETALSV